MQVNSTSYTGADKKIWTEGQIMWYHFYQHLTEIIPVGTWLSLLSYFLLDTEELTQVQQKPLLSVQEVCILGVRVKQWPPGEFEVMIYGSANSILCSVDSAEGW